MEDKSNTCCSHKVSMHLPNKIKKVNSLFKSKRKEFLQDCQSQTTKPGTLEQSCAAALPCPRALARGAATASKMHTSTRHTDATANTRMLPWHYTELPLFSPSTSNWFWQALLHMLTEPRSTSQVIIPLGRFDL